VGIPEVILLDTHVLVWVVRDDRKLGRRARALIDRFWPVAKVAVPAIAFWEIGILHARGRLTLPTALGEWRDGILEAGAVELPLDGLVAVRSFDLSGLHEDPADRFIVATALVHNATLLTADERLLTWDHALDRIDASK
jgi:PIN domain nuclease of toxin-antitoxin system